METSELHCFMFFGFIIVLVSLMHGFFWQLTRQNPAPPAPDQPNVNPGNGAPVVVSHPQREKEGKAQ